MPLRLSSILLTVSSILVWPAIISTTVLYLYPLFFGCEFPPVQSSQAGCSTSPSAEPSSSPKPSTLAPFRLLAFGDPQLEGDTSLPDYSESRYFPSFDNLKPLYGYIKRKEKGAIHYSLGRFYDEFWDDLKLLVWSYRKRLDLWGNDLYLAHQYRALQWWLQPTHVVVLGDLLGSQWIEDGEFNDRADRFWNRVFKYGKRVEDEIASSTGWTEALGEDDRWRRRVINVPGNHDVGYAGDLTEERMTRYENAFGRTNWDVTFTLPTNTSLPSHDTPSIRLIGLNSMNLDGPAFSAAPQDETYTYLNSLIRRSNAAASDKTLNILLTHIPLHKPAGVCVDDEYFTYHDDAYGGSIREQNHLSREASKPILEGVFGLKPNTFGGTGSMQSGLILSGHDHEGCSSYHYLNMSDPYSANSWSAVPLSSLSSPDPIKRTATIDDGTPGVREETLRSMMGSYDGHAGLISAWYESTTGWQVEVGGCDLGVQHYWWAVHALDLVFLATLWFGIIAYVAETMSSYKHRRDRRIRIQERQRRKSKSQGKSLSRTPSYRHTTGVNGSAKAPNGSVRRSKSKGGTETPRSVKETVEVSVTKRVKEENGSVRESRTRSREVETPSASVRRRRKEEGI